MHKNQFILLLLIHLILTQYGFSLTGKVLEQASLKPVSGAIVKVVGQEELSDTTDSLGIFSINAVTSINELELGSLGDVWFTQGSLYISLNKAAPIYFSLLNLKGETLFSHTENYLPGNHSVPLLSRVLKESTQFVGILRIASNSQSYQYSVYHLGNSRGPVLKLKDMGPSSLRKGASIQATNQIIISKNKLNDTLITFQNISDNLGNIVLRYPKRKLGVGAPAPYGAIMLFDGANGKESALRELQNNWGPWSTIDGKDGDKTGITFKVVSDPQYLGNSQYWTLQSCCSTNWGYDDLQAKEAHGDVQIHVEFMTLGKYDNDDIPNPNATESQSKGGSGYTNSGVYVQSRYEIQIESDNDTSIITRDSHKMASLVDDRPPTQNVLKPNGVWQSYDITFRTSRWNGNQMISPAYMTVYWNGVKVHDNVIAKGPATGLQNHSGENHSPIYYGLKLQSEGRDCRYRNIWIKHLTIDAPQTDFGY